MEVKKTKKTSINHLGFTTKNTNIKKTASTLGIFWPQPLWRPMTPETDPAAPIMITGDESHHDQGLDLTYL